MWTNDRVRTFVAQQLNNHAFLVIANREPYIHTYQDQRITCRSPTSGLVSALDPVMRSLGGVWIAHGSGDADRAVVDANDCVRVPFDAPHSYTLKRVWLSREEEEGYYDGFSNQTLWPLCHQVYERPSFLRANWELYHAINEKFTSAILEVMGPKPTLVWIHDYHFALLPRMLKARRPDCVIAQFWHIPWPPSEVFRICPWKAELLEGLLANDLLGFHLRGYCDNFLDTVRRETRAGVDVERSLVNTRDGRTYVRSYPISIDFDVWSQTSATPRVEALAAKMRARLGLTTPHVVVGVSRLDYTKGILEKLDAIERLLEEHPRLAGRVTFVEAAVPSRVRVPSYQRLHEAVRRRAQAINLRYGRAQWRPIVVRARQHSPEEIMALFALADVCVVNSLHDGMNLVAKEYVASKSALDGMIVLSRFAGAAAELRDAILVNPFDTDALAEAIRTALEMPRDERRRRMAAMRQVVAERNIYWWMGHVLHDLVDVAHGRDHRHALRSTPLILPVP